MKYDTKLTKYFDSGYAFSVDESGNLTVRFKSAFAIEFSADDIKIFYDNFTEFMQEKHNKRKE